MKNNKNKSETISIIMIGDTSVGKSTLMKKYVTGNFSTCLAPTLGVELYKKEITIDKKLYVYRIWDTCGQERFRSLSKSYFNSADGIMLLFDLNSVESFEHLSIWFNSIKECSCEDVPLVIVGTKSDLKQNVAEESINKLNFEGYLGGDIKVFKCSAKDDTGVEEPFLELANRIINKGKHKKNDKKIKISKGSSQNKEDKKKECC